MRYNGPVIPTLGGPRTGMYALISGVVVVLTCASLEQWGSAREITILSIPIVSFIAGYLTNGDTRMFLCGSFLGLIGLTLLPSKLFMESVESVSSTNLDMTGGPILIIAFLVLGIAIYTLFYALGKLVKARAMERSETAA